MIDLTPEERAVKLARMIVEAADSTGITLMSYADEETAITEARAIVALLPPEEDPGLAIVRKMVAAKYEAEGLTDAAHRISCGEWDKATLITCCLAAYKLGRQHEREGR